MRIMNVQKRPPKRGTNVSLDQELVAEAKSLGVNLSQSCENGLAQAVKIERERRWLEENADAIQRYNDFVEVRGNPLARYRQF